MSKLDSDKVKIPLPLTDLGYQVIYCHSINKLDFESVIMIPLTEEEEKQLDNGSLHVIKNGIEFDIDSKTIICYGEIDFKTNSDDFHTIEQMNWLDSLGYKGLCVPSDYDYEEHACYPPERILRYYETFNPAIISQYIHARLGKPERCCIFKENHYAGKRK